MTGNGYIKLHRKLLNWGWYKDQNTKAVFLHLLLTANYAESEYMGVKIHPGQTVIGRKSLAKTLGLSEKNIRTALNHLKETKEITIISTNKFSIATITGWELYQINVDEMATTFRKNTQEIQKNGQRNGHQNNYINTDIPNDSDDYYLQGGQQNGQQVANKGPASGHTIRNKESKNKRIGGRTPKSQTKKQELEDFYAMTEEWANEQT